MQVSYVHGGYTDDSASQIAKEQDTKLEILKHPAAYYRVGVDRLPGHVRRWIVRRNLKTCRRPGLGQTRLDDWDKADSAQPHHTVRNVANFLRREVERGPLHHRTLRS